MVGSIPAGRGIAAIVAILAALTAPVSAQFLAPTQISSGSTGCANPAVERDVTNNIAFAYDCDGDIFFASTVFAPGVDVNTTNGALSATRPDILAGFGGQIRIVFQRESPQPGATGDDIMTITNTGGPWGSPITLVLSDDADQDPRIAQSFLGEFAFSWWHNSVGGVDQVFVRRGLSNPNENLGPGSGAVVAYDLAELLHVVFVRDGDLVHLSHDGAAYSAETTLGTATSPDRVSIAAFDDLHVAYSSGGTILYSTDEGGSFSAAETLDTGTTGSPRVTVGASGHVAVVYEKGGSILVRERVGGVFGPATTVATGTTAQTPDVAIDSNGYLHVAYEEGGAIFYTNNVPLPTPEFSSNVTEGEIFLGVEFTNESTGVYSDILWDFGDGTTSDEENPTHIYETVGTYTVSLTLTGPGGTATETKTSYISALPPTNILEIPHVLAFASQAIRHPVLATSTDPFKGFQLAVRYDQGVTPITEVNFANTVTGAAAPEFVAVEFNPNGADSFLIVGVLLEVQKPIEGDTIEPGTGQLLATLDYTIPIGLSLGTTSDIILENGLGMPPINNVFSGEDGFSVLPFLISGSVAVDSIPTDTFLRGDATVNGGIDIADAIFVLGFLFTGGASPLCPDSADANDTGAIDVADTITILNYLFVDGPVPPYPFPTAGLDPTPDSLGPCLP